MKFTKTKKKPVEVFRLFPAYQTISKKRKKDVLLILQEWVKSELNKLSS
jgi:hypothetical protein